MFGRTVGFEIFWATFVFSGKSTGGFERRSGLALATRAAYSLSSIVTLTGLIQAAPVWKRAIRVRRRSCMAALNADGSIPKVEAAW